MPLVLIPYLYHPVSVVACQDDRDTVVGDRTQGQLAPVRHVAQYRRLG